MIANAIHANGSNPDGPMVKFNCAALPERIASVNCCKFGG